jgi:hypothetical protein
MNLEGCRRKHLWPICSTISEFAWRNCEKLQNTSVIIASLFLNSRPPKYEARMLPIQSNIVMYWLVPVFHIQEVKGSSLRHGISCPYYFHDLPQSLQIRSGVVPEIRSLPHRSKSIPFHYSSYYLLPYSPGYLKCCQINYESKACPRIMLPHCISVVKCYRSYFFGH